jgi:hypothetical protein
VFPIAGDDIDRTIDIDLEHRAEVVGWSGELVDLFAEDTKLLSSLFQDGGELIVLGRGTLQPVSGPSQFGFELTDTLGCPGSTTTKDGHLFFESFH